MSFATLLNGTDCQIQSNPLHQALKQTSQDSSLQRDRFSAGNPSIAGPSSLRTLPANVNSRIEEQNFLQYAPYDLRELQYGISSVDDKLKADEMVRLHAAYHQHVTGPQSTAQG